MRVLGPAIITPGQQLTLLEGSTLIIRPSAVFPSAARYAGEGHLLWVREPWMEVTGKIRVPAAGVSMPGEVHEIVFGYGPVNRIGMLPNWLKPHRQSLKFHQRKAEHLTRSLSRACLEIIQRVAEGWLCLVRLQQVDEYLKVRAAQ